MFTRRIRRGWGIPGGTQEDFDIEITYDGISEVSATVEDGETGKDVLFSLDVSQAKGLFLHSTKDVTVITNSGAGPNTFDLKADKPFTWIPEDGDLRDTAGTEVSTDITKLVVANASGDDAVLTAHAIFDSTP